jgi:DNA end-binding protein Ku
MPAVVWKGQIAFGLVSFPVKLHAAARHQNIRFHQLHQCDQARVKQVLYCQAEDRPLARTDLVRGFEYEPDRYVVVEERELDQLAPRSSRVIEVREFVSAVEVDPVYLDASYYIVPEAAGEKPYTLLYEAMRRSGYAALAQWTLHSREHLALLRPGRCGVLLHTLFYADEVRALDEFRTEVEGVSPRELELAALLVERLAAGFEPGKYTDTYRENLRQLLDAKIRGEELRLGTSTAVSGTVPDILEGLKASLTRFHKPATVARRSAVSRSRAANR